MSLNDELYKLRAQLNDQLGINQLAEAEVQTLRAQLAAAQTHVTAALADAAILENNYRVATANEADLRAQLAHAKERERVAIVSWDEERQRALREGARVTDLRALTENKEKSP